MGKRGASTNFTKIGVAVSTIIDKETNKALNLVKQARKRSKSFLIKEAIEKFVSSPDCFREPSITPEKMDSPISLIKKNEGQE